MATTITTAKCTPFLLRVMVYSPESGYKFTIEIQKACTVNNEAVWKLLFDLYKKDETGSTFTELVSVEFVAGTPDEIAKVAEITEDGMKRAQVRAFRENVYPLVKPFADNGTEPTDADHQTIDTAISSAIKAA